MSQRKDTDLNINSWPKLIDQFGYGSFHANGEGAGVTSNSEISFIAIWSLC